MALIKLQNTMIEEVEIPWNKPTLLKGFCRDMKAVKKWNDVSYLKTNFMNAKVDVEYYKTETDFETSISKIKSMRFNEYFDQMGDRTYVPDCSLFDMSDDISENIFTDLINPNDVRIGLKNFDGKIGIPDDYNLYIGVNTKTGMHVHIEDDFMLNQVVGNKKIYFLDYEHLNIKPFWNKYQNFSRENFFRMNWDKMDIYYAELEPGDSVCIPPWWWHAVESDGYSIGVAKLWEREDQYDLYKDNPKYLSLHRRNWFSAFLGKYIFDWVRKIF